jgi:hypothetical protein
VVGEAGVKEARAKGGRAVVYCPAVMTKQMASRGRSGAGRVEMPLMKCRHYRYTGHRSHGHRRSRGTAGATLLPAAGGGGGGGGGGGILTSLRLRSLRRAPFPFPNCPLITRTIGHESRGPSARSPPPRPDIADAHPNRHRRPRNLHAMTFVTPSPDYAPLFRVRDSKLPCSHTMRYSADKGPRALCPTLLYTPTLDPGIIRYTSIFSIATRAQACRSPSFKILRPLPFAPSDCRYPKLDTRNIDTCAAVGREEEGGA